MESAGPTVCRSHCRRSPSQVGEAGHVHGDGAGVGREVQRVGAALAFDGPGDARPVAEHERVAGTAAGQVLERGEMRGPYQNRLAKVPASVPVTVQVLK